jgi:predicted Kef-type K+ transport protein
MDVLFLAVAFGLGLGARQLGLPPLVGFLAAGFALRALGHQGGEALDHVAQLGVQLLLFTVGLKMRLQNLVRPEVWAGGLLHLGITTATLAPLMWLWLGAGWHVAGIIAVALAFSSTVLAAKVLEDKRELRSFHGRVAIGILIVQDLVAVAALGLLEGTAPSSWALLLLVLFPASRLLAGLVDLVGHGELLVLIGMVLALAVGGLAFESVGLSGELGALILGTMLANHPRAQELANALWSLKEVYLVGFFLSIGMTALPTLASLGVAVVLLALLPLKAALFFWIFTRFRLRARSAALAALALASYSEFGLVVAAEAVRSGLLAPSWLVTLALTLALAFAFGAYLNRIAHGLYERFEQPLMRCEAHEKHPDDAPVALGSAEIIIVGMGRVGTGAYDQLKLHGEKTVGMDTDPAKIQKHIAAGRRVFYGDAEDAGYWHRVNLEGVRAVLLAMPDVEAKLIAARELRARGYAGLISATNVYPEEAKLIVESGCDTTFNYYSEAGVGFAEHTWQALRTDVDEDTVAA